MKYFIDTEFHEYQKKPLFSKPIDTIELISIGIVREEVVHSYTLHYIGKPMPVDHIGNTWNRTTSTNFEELHDEAIKRNSIQDGWAVKENKSSKEYYAICKEFDLKAAWKNEWVRENVLKPIYKKLRLKELSVLYNDIENIETFYNDKYYHEEFSRLINKYGKTRKQIADEIKHFVYHCREEEIASPSGLVRTEDLYKNIEFYGYYSDYDWVVFCWIFGRMMDLPKGFPMYCKDLKQIMDDFGLDKDWKHINCPDPDGEHNALADAKWNYELYKFLQTL